MENVSTPQSWCELIEALYEGDWDEKIKRHRSSFAFRGLVDSSYEMETSLIRLGGEYKTLEKHLLRNFRKYAHRDVVVRDSFWHWLAIAQHHGLPTRLLDWTYSPFVALHFATNELSKMDKESIVWCVNIPDTHKFLPKSLKNALQVEGSYVFTIDMLSNFEVSDVITSRKDILEQIKQSKQKRIRNLEDFDNLSNEPFALFMEPSSIDDRIVNQYALFSIISNPTITMNNWLSQHPNLYRKVKIPPSLKWEVRDKLDQANITERVLFPGLDGLSSWLTRNYSPGPLKKQP